MIGRFWWQRIQLFLLGTLMVAFLQSCQGIAKQSLYTPPSQPPECRVVQHELGQSCVPLHPRRVVVMDQESLEILVALGLHPIAATSSNRIGDKTPLLKQKNIPVINLGKEGSPNLERIVRLKPDLIVGMFIDSHNYELFSRIAPTVSIQFSHAKWKTTLEQFGDVLNKPQEVQDLLNAYHQKVSDLSSRLKRKLGSKKVSIMRFYTTLEFTQFLNHLSFPGSVIEDLKFVSIPPVQQQLKGSDETYVQVSLERVDWLDADAIFVALDPGAEKNFQVYAESPLWQTLSAVKKKHVYIVDSSYWIFGSILSANAILDDVARYLEEPKDVARSLEVHA